MTALISHENMITFLLTTPMFEDLEPQEIAEIINIVEAVKFQPGETIFSEGDPGDAWYALYRGEIEVLKQSDNGEKTINVLEPRSCFGEIAVLDGLPRSATVRAVEESVVLRIPQSQFQALIAKDHLIAHKLIRHMALLIAGRQRTHTDILSKLLLESEIVNIHQGIRAIVGEASVRE